MFVHNINPVFLDLGFFQIRYYGLVYFLGFIFTMFFLQKNIRRMKGLEKNDIYELMLWLITGLIIGSRIFIFLIWYPSYYFAHPWEFFFIWEGGMSFHGGLAGIIVAGLIFSKKKKVKFLNLADMIAIPASIILFFGRIANFINGELYGKLSNVPWAVKFPGAEGFRHPSQIYEGLKNLAIFFTLSLFDRNIAKRKKMQHGFIFFLFLIMYAVLRFTIEFWRENYWFFLGISKGQILCLIMLAVGIVGMIKIRKNAKPS